MSKRRYPTSSRKYDVPLYCAGWVVPRVVEENGAEMHDSSKSEVGKGGYIIVGGGGGDRRNGVQNNLVVAFYDSSTAALSESIYRLSTDDDPPYRLIVHPNGHDIICSFSSGCRLFEAIQDGEIRIVPSDKELSTLQNIGEQNRVVFSVDGRRFAAGGEDGHLRVFEWPSLEVLLNRSDVQKSIKDVDFSLDGALLATTGANSTCQIWDLATSSLVTSLSSKGEGDFGFCLFSRDHMKPLLYITVVKDGKGYVAVWNIKTWKKLGVKKLQAEPISAFSISPDGTSLAIGSSEGNISIIQVKNLTCSQQIKGAHMVFVTSLKFSPDGRKLLSVSADSSARVTKHDVEKSGVLQVTSLSWLLLAVALVFLLLSILSHRGELTFVVSRFFKGSSTMEATGQLTDQI